jgi:hypothetical protein
LKGLWQRGVAIVAGLRSGRGVADLLLGQLALIAMAGEMHCLMLPELPE